MDVKNELFNIKKKIEKVAARPSEKDVYHEVGGLLDGRR
jgi:hypothetical protein